MSSNDRNPVDPPPLEPPLPPSPPTEDGQQLPTQDGPPPVAVPPRPTSAGIAGLLDEGPPDVAPNTQQAANSANTSAKKTSANNQTGAAGNNTAAPTPIWPPGLKPVTPETKSTASKSSGPGTQGKKTQAHQAGLPAGLAAVSSPASPSPSPTSTPSSSTPSPGIASILSEPVSASGGLKALSPRDMFVSQVKTVDEDEEDEDEEDDVEELLEAIKKFPPYIVSCLLHIAFLIILAMLTQLTLGKDEFVLEVRHAHEDDQGGNPDTELFEETEFFELEQNVDVIADEYEFDVTHDPVFSMEELPVELDGMFDVSEFTIPDKPTIKDMLVGRQPLIKEDLLKKFGGTPVTEEAVWRGLQWLYEHQDVDGMWSLSGSGEDVRDPKAAYRNGSKYPDGPRENKCAATAMAMLAFQGVGQTHLQGPNEDYQETMKRAVKGLLSWQDVHGGFTQKMNPKDKRHLLGNHKFYTHALCAFALCELYAMTEDKALRGPAQQSINFLVGRQHQYGGWRYGINKKGPQGGSNSSDLSVTGWVMMAMQSARMGRLHVPQGTLDRISHFLDRVSHGGSQYAYGPKKSPTMAMTAEGLLCRQFLGWDRDNEKLLQGAKILSKHPIGSEHKDDESYYWYYATQVMHNMEGRYWERWNAIMSKKLPAAQIKGGPLTGSWSPKGVYDKQGGRLYVTCMRIYMLEVYYRHLPVYSVDLNELRREAEEAGKPPTL